MGQLTNILLQLLQIFCGNNQKPQQGQQQQQQHQQQQQQQQGGWNQQQQPGWQKPPQQQQQQQQYPPSWPQGQAPSGPAGGNIEQLRNQARQEGDLAHKCFADSQAAYKSGDGARAHELSMQGKQHQAKQDQLDDRAAELIFLDKNSHQNPGTIDLHGLYVKEAIEQVDKAIANGQRNGLEELRIITGKGIHSQNHQAKIKPAVEQLMQKYNLSAELDPHNAGVLVVDLNGSTVGNRTRDAGGLVDRMGERDGDCVIM